MKKLLACILLLTFLTNTNQIFSEESYYPGVKTAVGTAATIGSLVLWRYLNKKIKHLERTQIAFEKMKRFENSADIDKRIKKLTRYKYFSLFAAFLSFGYTINKAIKFVKSFEPIEGGYEPMEGGLELVEEGFEPEEENFELVEGGWEWNKKNCKQWGDNMAAGFPCKDGKEISFFYELKDQVFSYGVDRWRRTKQETTISLKNHNKEEMISAWLDAWKSMATLQCKLSPEDTWKTFKQKFNLYRKN